MDRSASSMSAGGSKINVDSSPSAMSAGGSKLIHSQPSKMDASPSAMSAGGSKLIHSTPSRMDASPSAMSAGGSKLIHSQPSRMDASPSAMSAGGSKLIHSQPSKMDASPSAMSAGGSKLIHSQPSRMDASPSAMSAGGSKLIHSSPSKMDASPSAMSAGGSKLIHSTPSRMDASPSAMSAGGSKLIHSQPSRMDASPSTMSAGGSNVFDGQPSKMDASPSAMGAGGSKVFRRSRPFPRRSIVSANASSSVAHLPQKENPQDTFICSKNKNPLVDAIDESKIHFSERLNVKRITKLDRVIATVPKPKNYVPASAHWPGAVDHPLSKTLPAFPKPNSSSMYYSRGAIGQSLNRPARNYTVSDPYNRELVISCEYNDLLHDPTSKKYFEKSVPHESLVEQKLVSNTNQVICNKKEFGKYRQYLFKRIYAEDVKQALTEKDAHEAAFRELKKVVTRDTDAINGKVGLRNQRLKDVSEFRRGEALQKSLIAMEKEKVKALQEQRCQEMKAQAYAERRAYYDERDQLRRHNLERLEIQRLNTRAQLIYKIVAADKAAAERRVTERASVQKARREFKTEWANAKFKAQEDAAEKQQILQDVFNDNFVSKAEKRQIRMERMRERLPEVIQKRKDEYDRLWAIVRKYFNRWRDNVRKRKALRPDAMHQTNWDVSEVTKQTLDFLKKQSGYEKLDDLILGIVALKKRIQAELAAEEAAEAAAEAAAAVEASSSKIRVREDHGSFARPTPSRPAILPPEDPEPTPEDSKEKLNAKYLQSSSSSIQFQTPSFIANNQNRE